MSKFVSRIDCYEDGTVDDVAVSDVTMFHMEMMDNNSCWLRLETKHGDFVFWLESGRCKLKIRRGET